MAELRQDYGQLFWMVEWGFTGLFTMEYLVRLVTVRRPWGYLFSFYGLIDLLAVVPGCIGLFFPQLNSLMVIRSLRLLRIFRVLKMSRYLKEADLIVTSLKASHRKIFLFLDVVVALALILGTLMYLVEGEENGFTSIPKAMYWAIVTLTTVGYGDIAPKTVLGQAIASTVMLMGYAIIAVPTGIITAGLTRAYAGQVTSRVCPECTGEGHEKDAHHCKLRKTPTIANIVAPSWGRRKTA